MLVFEAPMLLCWRQLFATMGAEEHDHLHYDFGTAHLRKQEAGRPSQRKGHDDRDLNRRSAARGKHLRRLA
jgi:hypothetical protein